MHKDFLKTVLLEFIGENIHSKKTGMTLLDTQIEKRDRGTDCQMDRHTYRQTDRRKDGQMDRCKDGQRDRQTDRDAERRRDGETDTDRRRDGQTDGQTDLLKDGHAKTS